MFYNGIRVIENSLMGPFYESVQFRFPKSKKKRIRKKWANRRENYRLVESERAILHNGCLYVSSKMYEFLKSEIDEK